MILTIETDNLVGGKEIAERFGVDPSCVGNWIHLPGFPEPLARPGGRPVWDMQQVDIWYQTEKRPHIRRRFVVNLYPNPAVGRGAPRWRVYDRLYKKTYAGPYTSRDKARKQARETERMHLDIDCNEFM